MKLPQMVRNLWIYRRVVLLAVLLGIVVAFVFTNNQEVRVKFPFFLGELTSTSGVIMLVSAALGATACWVLLTLRRAWEEAKEQHERAAGRPGTPPSSEEVRAAAAGAPPQPQDSPPGGPGKEAEGCQPFTQEPR
jgi:uncharacterized integral membrane protein